MMSRFGRFHLFLLVSATLVGVVVVIAGLLVGRFFERYVLAQEEAQTAEIVQNQARQHLTRRDLETVGSAKAENFQAFLEGLPGVFRIKAFDRVGRIVWSNEPRLIGQIFPDNPYLIAALRGTVTTVLEAPERAEHVYEQDRGHIAEAYVPIVLAGDPQPIGVVETYKDTTGVVRDIRRTQRTIWAVGGGMGLLLWAALAAVVWKASVNEYRAIRRLAEQNHELTLLQRFTQGVLRPVDLTQLAATVVESAGTGLHLAEANLYRIDPGGAPALLARWPSDATPKALPGPLAAQAVESRSRVVSGRIVAIPTFTQNGAPHLFIGRVDSEAADPGAATWRTLEIMLQEASIALANVELFTEIREAHERLAAILAGVADRMMIVDREMRVVWMNPAAAAAAGGSTGQTCFEIMGTTAEGCVACPAVRTFQSGRVERGVRAQTCAGASTKYLDLITAPLRDASGNVHQVLEVARDVTELVEMEERLKATNQALLAAQAQLVEKERLAAVGQLVVGLHHSILNPLTGILGALQVLKQMPASVPEQARAIAAAEDEVRKIERLVRRLPEIQRTEETPYLGRTTMLDLEHSCGDENVSGEGGPGAG